MVTTILAAAPWPPSLMRPGDVVQRTPALWLPAAEAVVPDVLHPLPTAPVEILGTF